LSACFGSAWTPSVRLAAPNSCRQVRPEQDSRANEHQHQERPIEGTRECEAPQVVLIRCFSESEPEESDDEDDYGHPPHQKHDVDRQANWGVPPEAATR